MRRGELRAGTTLPDALQRDLEELLNWSGRCYLRWVPAADAAAGPDGTPARLRHFSVRMAVQEGRCDLSLEFSLPETFGARTVQALLPAHMLLTGCVDGERAWLDLPGQPPEAVKASLPRLARTCARMMNELWGRTEAGDVLLMTMDYEDRQLDLPLEERT